MNNILSQICSSGMHCWLCRNKKDNAFRMFLFNNKYVNEIDFVCPQNIQWDYMEDGNDTKEISTADIGTTNCKGCSRKINE